MSGLIPQRFVEELLDRIDLAELIGSRITLKKAGGNYKACCPFHDEKTPSFNVRPDKGFYHCFGCGAHGDAISFIREFDGLGFTDAVEELARRQGLEVPYDRVARQEMQQARTLTDALDFASQFYQGTLRSPQGNYARDYLQQRGLDAATTERYQLGFAPGTGTALFEAAAADLKGPLVETGTVSDRYGRPRDLFRNRIMFPIRNSRGRTVAFGGRTLGDDKAKYINSPESDVFHKSREIYGLFEARQAIRQLDRLLVVEGYMDVIALAQHGIHYAVATLGTATNQDSLTALLRQVRHLVFCFDGDAAGHRAADRAMENALELLADGLHLQFLMLPQGEDPDTLVRKEGPDAFQQRIDGATPLSRYLFNRKSEGLDLALPEHRGELRARVEPLLNKMPRCTLRDAMWHEMLRLCGGKRDWQNNQRGDGGRGKFGRFGHRRDRIQEERIDVRLNKDSLLCLALVEAPELATEVLELARIDRQLPQARQLASWIDQQQIGDQRQLLSRLALDSQAHGRFFGLFDGIEHVPKREQTLAVAREMLQPDQEAARKQRLAALLNEKRSLADLSDAERQELRQLSRHEAG
ncbi:DNA primase [Marinobacter xestospongiae]|uniref:DNA primase n=1 Tax=Marinobacter xestospongiae TaxID=994319 RepID=UPI002006898D|nr:DNA primase [Marinobacter xestospongiae]MCK7568718.1 DNA primase [Marinobacter xestospongiae]